MPDKTVNLPHGGTVTVPQQDDERDYDILVADETAFNLDETPAPGRPGRLVALFEVVPSSQAARHSPIIAARAAMGILRPKLKLTVPYRQEDVTRGATQLVYLYEDADDQKQWLPFTEKHGFSMPTTVREDVTVTIESWGDPAIGWAP